MITKDHPKLSLSKQCELMSINRSSYYYESKRESPLNIELMRQIDEHYLEHPYKGFPQMYTWLTKDKHYEVNRKRIARLYYQVMGLRAIQPGPHTSKRGKDHKVYPYLLRGLEIEKPNHVWATDITYIPMKKGFMYLIAFIDLHSRYVLNWSVSNTMDKEWVTECLQETIDIHGCPEILNTDQGSQFTSELFSSTVLANDIKLSMDGKGRATDNAFIERLWRSVKYEKIYINPPMNGNHLHQLLVEYFQYYNNERRHSSIEKNRPVDYFIQQLKAVA